MSETNALDIHTSQTHAHKPPLTALKLKNVISRATLIGFLTSLSIALIGTIGVLMIQLLLLSEIRSWDLFLLFIPFIAVIGHFAGYRSGMLMTILSSLVIAIFLLPQNTLLQSPIELLQVLLFLISGLIISYLTDTQMGRSELLNYQERELELQRTITRLHKEQEKAKEEIKARDEFLSIASHELKTPLTSMILQLQNVLHSIRNVSLANFSVENLLKKLDSAEQQSLRLSRMINDLLNVSLMTTGRMELEKEPMDLSETVLSVIERFSDKAKREGVEILINLDKGVVGTWDKLRIEQSIANLLTNAFKYGDGKPIEVQVRKHSHHAELIVKDQGIGIPRSLQEKIFDRFERVAGKASYQGLGVGLYITREIVHAHHGKIAVESNEGKGSTFTIQLPLTEKN